ncbi:hypothetical protein XENOCAPTIV_005384 [Xenoophorus captivus]|uniref:MANSC domain-containing protein n=1 Tax=Xenoophorus captivus TaxID=1517983 RepID=A0ABV0QLC5_9TELE
MALLQHPQLLLPCVFLLFFTNRIHARSSQISDLKSKISGVEELLEEFRKQLQQDQAYRAADVSDSCVGDFGAAEERIIRTKASIEQGATFLLAPDRVYTWRDCLHACCSQPHCTVAVVQKDLGRPGDSLSCYLFNCTYRNKNICSFAPQEGFTTYSRTPNATQTQGHLAASYSSATGRPRQAEEDVTQGGSLLSNYTKLHHSLLIHLHEMLLQMSHLLQLMCFILLVHIVGDPSRAAEGQRSPGGGLHVPDDRYRHIGTEELRQRLCHCAGTKTSGRR